MKICVVVFIYLDNRPIDMEEWLASRSSSLTFRERAPARHWIGDRMVPRAGLDVVQYREIFDPDGNQILTVP
jgi:hypothetical protein